MKYLLLKRTTKGECRVPKNFNFRSSGGSNWWARICDHFIHASLDGFLQFLKVWGCKETMRITCCYLCTRNSPSWSMEMHLANIHFCEKPKKVPSSASARCLISTQGNHHGLYLQKCYKHQIRLGKDIPPNSANLLCNWNHSSDQSLPSNWT